MAASCSTTRRRSACSPPRGCSARGSPSCCRASAGALARLARGRCRRGRPADLALLARDIRLRLLDTGTDEQFQRSVHRGHDAARASSAAAQLAALGRLTANIAHEIRNPLAAISHATELLDEENRGGDRERLTRIVHDNTQRLERLVADVLQLNRRDRISASVSASTPGSRLHREFVANESCRRAPEHRATREAWIEFDREHLHQVMWNLLRNAVRYARSEPRSVRIALGGFAGRVELSVIDNGPGVPPSARAAVRAVLHHRQQGDRPGPVSGARAVRRQPGVARIRQRLPGAHFRIVIREARAA